jgi:heme exporter protein A
VLHDPDVILFDEPYTGLDQDASSMLDEVLQTVAAKGRTVVMTSHDLARADVLAPRFDLLSRGVIAATASRKELRKTNLLSFYRQALAG